jgi:hypothetical protein
MANKKIFGIYLVYYLIITIFTCVLFILIFTDYYGIPAKLSPLSGADTGAGVDSGGVHPHPLRERFCAPFRSPI